MATRTTIPSSELSPAFETVKVNVNVSPEVAAGGSTETLSESGGALCQATIQNSDNIVASR
jgi:hypothetical protein